MRGEKIFKTLKLLKKITLTTAEFIDVFPNYNLTISKAVNVESIFSVTQNTRVRLSQNSYKTKRHKYDQLLLRLCKQGFIKKSKNQKWKPTPHGMKKLKKMENDPMIGTPVKYSRDNTTELKIIIFDIPERERRKRDWLRSVLKNLEFTMIQKSVWIGKSEIPIELIHDLKKLRLLTYVEIFAITKRGSLKIKKLT